MAAIIPPGVTPPSMNSNTYRTGIPSTSMAPTYIPQASSRRISPDPLITSGVLRRVGQEVQKRKVAHPNDISQPGHASRGSIVQIYDVIPQPPLDDAPSRIQQQHYFNQQAPIGTPSRPDTRPWRYLHIITTPSGHMPPTGSRPWACLLLP